LESLIFKDEFIAGFVQKRSGRRNDFAADPALWMFAYDFGEALGDGLTFVEPCEFCLPLAEPCPCGAGLAFAFGVGEGLGVGSSVRVRNPVPDPTSPGEAPGLPLIVGLPRFGAIPPEYPPRCAIT
jgi:hypothetical protein